MSHIECPRRRWQFTGRSQYQSLVLFRTVSEIELFHMRLHGFPPLTPACIREVYCVWESVCGRLVILTDLHVLSHPEFEKVDFNIRGGIGKFLDCYCCNWLGERRWESRPRSHCIILPRDTALWTFIVLTQVLFRLRVSFCLRWMAKSDNVSAWSFAWSCVNP
jgi:hypothetical protein